MSHIDQNNPYAVNMDVVASQPEAARATFIRKTYAHLTGAILALIALEFFWFQVVPEDALRRLVTTMISGWNWLIVVFAFMGVSTISDRWARNATSKGMQYGGLGLFIFAQSLILLPLLYYAVVVLNEPSLPLIAGLITAMAFIGLSAFVFITGVNLESWGKYLFMAGLGFLIMIGVGILFGFSFGLAFTAIGITLACAYILYQTSEIIRSYGTEQYVAAALGLFASVAMLFFYVLQFLTNRE